MNYSFTIKGNQTDPFGNPVPFQRVLKQHMRAASARYLAWQKFVRNVFASEAGDTGAAIAVYRGGHPIVLEKNQRARMDIFIWWANDAHGDPDNVFKGIADSLFENDKYLSGSQDFAYAPDKQGRVDVKIEIAPAPG